jgi:hypothetical protein
MIDSIPAGREQCPRCANTIGVRITPEGARMALHRINRTSAVICR